MGFHSRRNVTKDVCIYVLEHYHYTNEELIQDIATYITNGYEYGSGTIDNIRSGKYDDKFNLAPYRSRYIPASNGANIKVQSKQTHNHSNKSYGRQKSYYNSYYREEAAPKPSSSPKRELRSHSFDYEELSTPIKDGPGVVRSFQDIQRNRYNSNSNYGNSGNTYSSSRTPNNNSRPASVSNHSSSGTGKSKGNILIGILFGLWGIWGLTHGALNHIGSIIIMVIFFAIAWSNLFKK